jgi:hypothetical protein
MIFCFTEGNPGAGGACAGAVSGKKDVPCCQKDRKVSGKRKISVRTRGVRSGWEGRERTLHTIEDNNPA